METEIKIDAKAVEHLMGRLTDQRLINRILSGAVNASARSLKKESVLEAEKQLNLAKSKISSKIRVTSTRTMERPSTVEIRPVPIGLEKFKPTQDAFGLRVTVEKGKAEHIRHGFIVNIKGKRIPMIRKSALASSDGGTKYVVSPSNKPIRRRGVRGSELPINALIADPITKILESKMDKLVEIASEVGTNKVLTSIEDALDAGRG